MFYFGEKSLDRMQGVNPELRECAIRALSKCKLHDMYVPWRGGLRTAEEQNEIYKSGSSKLDGYGKKSYHQSGNALDVGVYKIDLKLQAKIISGEVPIHDGFREFAKNMFSEWQKGLIKGEFHGLLEWGGNWKSPFIDVPHWQVRL